MPLPTSTVTLAKPLLRVKQVAGVCVKGSVDFLLPLLLLLGQG